MTYNDTHRAFLQAIMHAGIMSDYDMKQKAVTIFGNQTGSDILTINNRLEPLGMMVKSGNCEFTGEKYWMLMSTNVDAVTLFQSEFTPGQLELLRNIFQEIISSEESHVSSLDCLNAQLEGHVTKAAREAFLNDMVRRMWLDCRDGYYYMGVRSIIELMPYFRATFEEGFNNCPLCKQAVFHGQRCEACQVVAHLYCLAKYARVQKPLKCSNCSNVIPTEDLPAVQDLTLDEDESVLSQEPQLRQKRRKREATKHRSDR